MDTNLVFTFGLDDLLILTNLLRPTFCLQFTCFSYLSRFGWSCIKTKKTVEPGGSDQNVWELVYCYTGPESVNAWSTRYRTTVEHQFTFSDVWRRLVSFLKLKGKTVTKHLGDPSSETILNCEQLSFSFKYRIPPFNIMLVLNSLIFSISNVVDVGRFVYRMIKWRIEVCFQPWSNP